MKLKRDSWHAKLNAFVYGSGYLESVDCLCPYFWGTLLAILISPLVLIGKGIAVCIGAIPHVNVPSMDLKTKNKVSNIIGYGCLAFITTLVTALIVSALIEFGLMYVLYWIGVIAGVTGAVTGVVFFGIWIKYKYDDWRDDHPKEDKPNILMEFVKAKKNKHCPLVQWV